MARKTTKAASLPVLVVSGGHHRHPGARVVLPGRNTPFMVLCGYCGERVRVVEPASETVTDNAVPLLARRTWGGFGFEQADVSSARIQYGKLVKGVTGVAVGSPFLGNSFPKKVEPVAQTPSPLSKDESAVASVFSDMLGCGEDYMTFLETNVRGPDTGRAVAAVTLLGLRYSARPTWTFNPRLPPRPSDLELIEQAAAGAPRRILVDVDLELRAWRILMEAWADPRPEVADEAAVSLDGGRPDRFGLAREDVHRPWEWLSEPERVRARRQLRSHLEQIVARPLTTIDALGALANIAEYVGVDAMRDVLPLADRLATQGCATSRREDEGHVLRIAKNLPSALLRRCRGVDGMREALRRLDSAELDAGDRDYYVWALKDVWHPDAIKWLAAAKPPAPGFMDWAKDALQRLPAGVEQAALAGADEDALIGMVLEKSSATPSQLAWNVWRRTGIWVPCLPDIVEVPGVVGPACQETLRGLTEAWKARTPVTA